jgi:hypothetical protein
MGFQADRAGQSRPNGNVVMAVISLRGANLAQLTSCLQRLSVGWSAPARREIHPDVRIHRPG